MAYLGKKGYTVFKKDLTSSQIAKIRDELTVKPFTTHGQEPSYPIYLESGRKFYLPRYYGMEELGKVDATLSPGQTIDLPFTGSLFPYQDAIIRTYLSHVGDSGGGLLDVEPGKGKTVMALNIISKLKRKTLVVVHKSFLMNQWEERIHTFLPSAKVGKIQGDCMDIEGKDIVLGMLQSLSSKVYPEDMWDSFGLCVFDECHHLSAEVFSKVMTKIVTPYTLGLSGTMTRKDGLTKVFKYFIGPVVHKEKSDLTTEVHVKTLFLQNEEIFEGVKTDFKGSPLYSCLVTKLDHSGRNALLLEVLKEELKQQPDQQVMILAHTKSLLAHLFEAVQKFETSVGYYLGGMKEAALKEAETKKIILGTYAMASEGLDIKTLTTLFMVTPKSDICQSVGRILRSKEHKPLVVDFVDEQEMFMSQYKKRLQYYQSKFFKIEEFDTFQDYQQGRSKIKAAKKTKKACLVAL
jgi:superfamily II DNA or RNA helicase